MLAIQVPWLVKTDDDMVNNIWRLGLLVNQLKHHTYVVFRKGEGALEIKERKRVRENKKERERESEVR